MKINSKHIELDLNLPGFEKKDIKVKISKNVLAVKALKKKESKIQKKDFYHHEKSFRQFSYFTSLPGINEKKAKINFKNGVLKIKAPKKKRLLVLQE